MSLHLDQTLTDAASKNLSAAEAFEALFDRELEARNTRSIDRRCRLAGLQAKHSIDSFNFNHRKTRFSAKVASSAFWISALSRKARLLC